MGKNIENIDNEIDKGLEMKSGQTSKSAREIEILFNSTQDALFMLKVEEGEFRYVFNNASHQDLTGLSSKYLYGKTIRAVLGTYLGEKHEKLCKECLEKRKTISFEEEFEFKGKNVVLLTKLTPFFEKEEQVYIVGSRVDITPLKRSLEKSKQLAEKFHAMFELHTAVMLLIDPTNGAIVDANPSASEFYGYSIQELKNMYIHEINMLDKEEVVRLRGLAKQKSQKYFLFPHRLKNGELRFVDVYSSPIEYGGRNVLYSIIFDVTEREVSKEELKREKELLNITLDSIADGVIATDKNGIINRVNRAAAKITRWKSSEMMGKNLSDVFKIQKKIRNTEILINKYGEEIPISENIAPIKGNNFDDFGMVAVFRNISKEIKEREKILYLSNHDSLTGLHNRRIFHEVWGKLDFEDQYPIGIIMGDVNGLKMTNDAFGHEVGDLLLIAIADLIKDSIKDKDVAIRWGGDEFVILCPESNQSEIEQIIEGIREMAGHKKINQLIELSISFGYALKINKKQKEEVLLQEAEEMMYQRKIHDSKKMRSAIIHTVQDILKSKNMETCEHTKGIETVSLMIGNKMNLNPEMIQNLTLLARIHDIGKVGIEDEILLKRETLSDSEWEDIKRHSEIGYRIALNIPELSAVAESILYHHERWDGTGYPKNLQQEEIPICSRIIAIADAYNVMIHDQIYKCAVSKDVAMAEIKLQSGKQFDPKIVDIFSQCI